jgi:hypothetical protein
MDHDEIQERIQGKPFTLCSRFSLEILMLTFIAMNVDDVHEDISQAIIDTLYNLINSFEILNENSKYELTNALMNVAMQSLESIVVNSPSKAKDSFKKVMFFLAVLCAKAEESFKSSDIATGIAEAKSTKGSKSKAALSAANKYDWVGLRGRCLSVLLRVVQMDPSHLWSMSMVQESFLTPIWTYALELLECRPVGIAGTGAMETSLRALCVNMLVECTGLFTTSGSVPLACALLTSLSRYEHMTSVAADIGARAQGGLLLNLMTEISRLKLTSERVMITSNSSKEAVSNETIEHRDDDEEELPITTAVSIVKPSSGSVKVTSTVKHVGMFLVNLAEVAPKAMCLYFSMVLPQLASDSHQIRYICNINIHLVIFVTCIMFLLGVL